MAELVKWLTRRIVVPLCMGSIPIFRPIRRNKIHSVICVFFCA